MITGKNIQ